MPKKEMNTLVVGTNEYEIVDATARGSLSSKQDTLVSGTNIKTINNQSIIGSGNIDIQSSDNYIAGDGISLTDSSEGVIISNIAGVYTGDDTASSPAPLNADQLEGYTVNTLIKFMFPIGSVLQNTNNVNPSTYITGTTWQLISSVALASEHVFGNGKGLALHDGTRSGTMGNAPAQWNLTISVASYGSEIGKTGAGGQAGSDTVAGVATKTQLGNNPENSGLIADTITVYTWERTA